jgi:hypothetical protein
MAITPPLSQGAGYGVVLGLGIAFALGTSSPLHDSHLPQCQS